MSIAEHHTKEIREVRIYLSLEQHCFYKTLAAKIGVSLSKIIEMELEASKIRREEGGNKQL